MSLCHVSHCFMQAECVKFYRGMQAECIKNTEFYRGMQAECIKNTELYRGMQAECIKNTEFYTTEVNFDGASVKCQLVKIHDPCNSVRSYKVPNAGEG